MRTGNFSFFFSVRSPAVSFQRHDNDGDRVRTVGQVAIARARLLFFLKTDY